MLQRSRALVSVALAALTVAAGQPAWADDLQTALALAYQTNPTLLAQRAEQRALDETVPQARAGLRPTLNAQGGVDYTRTRAPTVTTSTGVDLDNDGIIDTVTTGGNSESDSLNLGLNLTQTIYSAGRVGHGVTAAEAGVLAGRENLRRVEQQVLASVIQAYADVLRDVEILRIRQANREVLRRQLDESNARFEVGEITRTDVAQSEARLAQTEADLANAQAQLSVSRAAYAAVVGQSPGTLDALPALPGLPADFETAMDVALDDNPALRAAAFNQRAAEARVAQARSAYLPSAQLTASYGGAGTLNDPDLADRTSFRAGASVSIPLFTGGLNRSRVAQALEQANAAQIGVEGERRNVLQSVSSAYAQVVSARSTLQAGQEAVRAASVAAEGVRQEAQVGLRTTLDVLNQELELRSAEVTLASARRNEYVAQAQLLAAMGRLEGPDLVAVEAYDPVANYNRVRLRGALPWDGVIEAIDRIAAPPVVPAADAPDAPIDAQLKDGIIRTAPGA
ncbi:MAG: TolC family outer membrane protein [Brevundimonas sp.]|uniref:TolC family outer membrane protein n=1 Tax=Brevundimonas sp. TaxID=1871086 RepID=UPI0025BC7B6D|nr:TolC family outer membrane protein [Brevundimonas sp.]MBX3476539.1 TolC family outer membrane protein [Brevundimonas sp.]